MVYVGRNLEAAGATYYSGQEPSLLNPDLPTARPGAKHHSQLPYWPQYDRLDPTARAAVLDWISGGRQASEVEIGIVFLFFYGLERRIVVDAATDKGARAEIPLLIEELERLLRIYAQSGSFHRYASQLILYARLAYTNVRLYGEPLTLSPQMTAHDPQVTIALGQAAADCQVLSPDLALAWYLTSDEARLRTPARRCWEQFVQLFRARYQDRFPDGMLVPPNKSRIKLSYTPASSGLSSLHLTFPVGHLPDVTRLARPFRPIAEIAERCMDELNAYSRHIGKDPDQAKGLQAMALLPPELVDSRDSRIARLRSDFERRLATAAPFTARADLLFDYWPSAGLEKMSKREATQLMYFLERVGYGVEPDPRFGGPPPSRGKPIVVFRQSNSVVPSSPSAEYANVALVLHLATLVAASDGLVDRSELRTLELHIENAFGLSGNERRRLSAHVRWLIECGPPVAGLKKRMAHLTSAARRAIADFVVAVANADGRIEPSEVDVLRKIYSLLDLDPGEVFESLSSAQVVESAGIGGPVVVRPAKAAQTGYAVPPQPTPQLVDMDLVRRKLQETAQVSALLSDIFTDEEHVTAGASPNASPGDTLGNGGLGLDADQARFLQVLLEKTEWDLEALEALADDHSILLDGTIETINELAFERSGEPAIEWSDPIEINVATAQELLA